MSAVERLKMQSLATCNNYYYTGQYRKAISVLNQTLKIFPDDEIAQSLLQKIYQCAFSVGDIFVLDGHISDNGLAEVFGQNWAGEPLDGVSIMIFCDQGMGDTIQMLRYIEVMKQRWDCKVYLNCYAFFDEMFPLWHYFRGVDGFVREYIKTDFHTNILSIASILNGLDYECHYPAHHRALLNTPIPNAVYISPPKDDIRGVGLAWKTNAQNDLSLDKSIELELFRELGCELQSLLPGRVEADFIAQTEPVHNLLDTARRIAGLDLVISVDTAVLHLAGAMGVPTWGLLCKNSDPRWGDGDTTPWYPSVKLYRQTTDWQEVICRVKKDLGTWQNQK